MKKLVSKLFDFLIKIIENYEDYKYGYHINLDNGKYQLGNYIIK